MPVEFLKCEKCGNVVIRVEKGSCTPSCCGESMVALKPNTVDASKEKHVPAVTHQDGKLLVKIGSVPHPMLEEHHISFVVFEAPCGTTTVKHLKVGAAPEAYFLDHEHGTVYAYCNLHGLWKTEF